MKDTYRNYQDNIAFKFDYVSDEDKYNALCGILYSTLQFVANYNLSDELIEELNNCPDYDCGDNFKAINTSEFEDFLGENWERGWSA